MYIILYCQILYRYAINTQDIISTLQDWTQEA